MLDFVLRMWAGFPVTHPYVARATILDRNEGQTQLLYLRGVDHWGAVFHFTFFKDKTVVRPSRTLAFTQWHCWLAFNNWLAGDPWYRFFADLHSKIFPRWDRETWYQEILSQGTRRDITGKPGGDVLSFSWSFRDDSSEARGVAQADVICLGLGGTGLLRT